MDSLAPACSVLADLWLHPDGSPDLAKSFPWKQSRYRDRQTFRRFPSDSSELPFLAFGYSIPVKCGLRLTQRRKVRGEVQRSVASISAGFAEYAAPDGAWRFHYFLYYKYAAPTVLQKARAFAVIPINGKCCMSKADPFLNP